MVVTILSKSCLKPRTLSCNIRKVLLYSSALCNFWLVDISLKDLVKPYMLTKKYDKNDIKLKNVIK